MIEKPRKSLFADLELDSSFFDSKRFDDSVEKTRKRGPEYRRKHAYVKGIAQYKKERKRRKQVWELSGKLNQTEIARQLGVSIRTVQRGMSKVRRYYQGMFNRFCRELQGAKIREVQAKMEGMSPLQKLDFLGGLIAQQRKEEERRKRVSRTCVVTINLDDLTDGIPSVKPFMASNTINLREGLDFVIRCIKDGQKHDLGGWTLKYAKKTT